MTKRVQNCDLIVCMFYPDPYPGIQNSQGATRHLMNSLAIDANRAIIIAGMNQDHGYLCGRINGPVDYKNSANCNVLYTLDGRDFLLQMRWHHYMLNTKRKYAVVLYDVNKRGSFRRAIEVASELNLKCIMGVNTAANGTLKHRKVSYQEAFNEAKALGCIYVEISTENGFNVHEAIEFIID